MKSGLPFVTAAALAAIGFANAADTPAPPPPPPAAESGANQSLRGKAGLAAGHHPLLGLLKEVEEKGKVTKEEFLNHSKKQAEETFSKLDKNHDGVIDKSETGEMESRMKGTQDRMKDRGKPGTTRKRPGTDAKPDSAKPDSAKPDSAKPDSAKPAA